MLVAAACLMVFAVAASIRLAARDRPVERNEIHRLRRFSEKL
jgi:hypothetical protein